MDTKTRIRYEARAKILKAMAHPSRLLILDQLAAGGAVCLRVDRDDRGGQIDGVKASERAEVGGLVSDDKRGLQVFYTLRVPCAVRASFRASRAWSSRTRKPILPAV
jgi:hypothetical protein